MNENDIEQINIIKEGENPSLPKENIVNNSEDIQDINNVLDENKQIYVDMSTIGTTKNVYDESNTDKLSIFKKSISLPEFDFSYDIYLIFKYRSYIFFSSILIFVYIGYVIYLTYQSYYTIVYKTPKVKPVININNNIKSTNETKTNSNTLYDKFKNKK